jgi:uncharacterized membrane protein
MNAGDLIFIFGLLSLCVHLCIKLYNVMCAGKFYDTKMMWITWVTFLFSYLMVFVTSMDNPEELIFRIFFNFSNYILVLFMALFIGEVLLMFRDPMNIPNYFGRDK